MKKSKSSKAERLEGPGMGNIATRRQKTYKEIVAWNKRHPLKDGWRGQVVLGGGPAEFGESINLTRDEWRGA